MIKLKSGQTIRAKITMPFLLIALLILTNVLNPKVNAENAGPYGAAMLKEMPPGYSRTLFEVKFLNDSNVQAKGSKLTGLSAADTTSLTAISQRFSVVAVNPVFTTPKGTLDQMRTRGERISGKDLPDLSTWMRYEIASGDDAEAFMSAMRAQDSVYSIEPAALQSPMHALDTVYSSEPAALPLSPQAITPDFTGEQGYLEPAPVGIDAYYSWGIPGGDGAGITIFDVEYDWNQTHEDLSKIHGLPLLMLPGDSIVPGATKDHGTAIVSVLVGDENGIGVTGISKGASVGLAPAFTEFFYPFIPFNPANAINLATNAATPGDVILLELAVAICGLPGGEWKAGPVEWIGPAFEAIQTATANGIVVVEAGGNGNVDLDQAACGSTFDRNVQDSGAILVGGGGGGGTGASNLQRLDYASYGSRLDVQGWGENVVAAGFGGYYKNPNDPDNEDYFYSKIGGTSSASAVVAGAVANLQGVAKNHIGAPLTPNDLRMLLVQTGTPQLPDESQKIGPRPDLALAIAQIINIDRDWGDLPDSFDTTAAEGGPSHIISTDLYLGECIDADADGQPDPVAGVFGGGGDEGDGSPAAAGVCQYSIGRDDDGLTLVTPLIPGHDACIEIDAVNSGADATLYGWFDFNGDGDFDGDTNEALVFTSGSNTVSNGGATDQEACFTIPANATFDGGETHVRFRLTRDTLTAGDWGGPANDGEVEGYYTPLSCVSNLVWHDVDGDGIQGDPVLEPGIDGVDVNLVWAGRDGDLSTPGDNRTYGTTTANGGRYSFCGLVPAYGTGGKYQVQIPTPPAGLPLATQVGQGTSFIDSDGDQPGGVNTSVFSPAFTLPSAGPPLPTGENGRGDAPPNNFPDEQEDSSIDFGFYTPPGNMSNVQISHNNADIFLTWDPVPGAQVYDVWQSVDEPYLTPAADCESDTSCTAVTQNAFTDNDILGSAPFAVYYTIIPRNSGGTAISPPSASVGAFSFATETGNT